MQVRKNLIVTGRVQGVGFRYFVQDTASKAGLRGFVRNISDGSVEIDFECDSSLVPEFLRNIAAAYPGAVVKDIVSKDLAPAGIYKTFEIKTG